MGLVKQMAIWSAAEKIWSCKPYDPNPKIQMQNVIE